DELAPRRDEHVVVQLVGELAHDVLEGDEVEDVVVLVEWAFDLGGHAIVMAVQALALAAVVRDEMPGAKDQVVLGDADGVVLGHLNLSPQSPVRSPKSIGSTD